MRLRAWTEADAAALYPVFGDAETMRFWDAPPHRDIAETEAFIRLSRSAPPETHAAFAIVRRDGGPAIGMVNYHDRRAANRRLAVGWIVARPFQRQGLMREAVPALLAHCFGVLGTHRVEARIEPENQPSVRLAEHLGFALEGLMRDWMWVGDVPRSPCLYALTRPDRAAR